MPKKHKTKRQLYGKGGKRRQRYLMDNHAFTTAFITAILSNHFDLIISFPVIMSTICLTFPRIRCIILDDIEEINLYQLTWDRVQSIKKEKLMISPDIDHRMNYIMHYEIYHFIYDMVSIIEDFEMKGEIEEPSGLSGDYSIRLGERTYNWEEIRDKGKIILEKIYENRKEGERRRLLKRGCLREYLV